MNQPANAASARTVTLIRGDGIGPEIADAVCSIFDAAGVPIVWDEANAGLDVFEATGTPLPESVLQSIATNGVALKGPTTTPIGTGHKSVNVTIRKALDLFANVRPSRSLPSVSTRFEDVDLIIVRENIEDTYGGIEHCQTPDVHQGLKLITRPGSLAVHRYAFEMARREGRKKVTCVHKANIHKLTDGLFLECFRQVAPEYPEIEADDLLIDNTCMQLVSDPTRFDVIVTLNLFGDILSDLCAGLVGGLGVAPGGNIGAGRAVFEAVHGSAPDIAGKGLANPTALLLSGVQMLRYLGLMSHASRIEAGLRRSLIDHVHTRDLGGNATTDEFASAVISNLPAPDASSQADAEAPEPINVGKTGPVVVSDENWECIGADMFVRNDGLPDMPKEVGPLKLSMISNRGTKVYPGPTPDILLVDHHRCRYLSETPITEADVRALIQAVGDKYAWMHIEKLHRDSAGERMFSRAQGE